MSARRAGRRVGRAGTSLAFVALAAAASPAWAGDSAIGPKAPESREEVASVESGDARTLGRLPANLGRGFVGVFHGENLVPFLAGGTATASASFFDQDVRNSIQDLGWGSTVETGAGPVWSSAFVAGMFAAGQLSHHPRFRATTYDMLDAAVVNFVYTEAIKAAVGRERPNGQDHKSFPSGHTSNAFALAAVAEGHYGWKIGAPAYLLAAFVGASRLEQDKHYLSDVVAGATLGYIVGRTVVRVNGRPVDGPGRRGAALSVAPILARHAQGAVVSVLF
jgi:membrane-associated phospholipid phosphatase